MHAHADKVLRARLFVETDQIVRVELVGFPGLDHCLEAKLRGMAVSLNVMFVLPFSFYIHAARVPVAVLGGRLWPPVIPDAELRVAIPVRNAVSLERFAGGFEGPGFNARLGLLYGGNLHRVQIRYRGA